MKFDHFEDMMVWQKSQELTLLIYKLQSFDNLLKIKITPLSIFIPILLFPIIKIINSFRFSQLYKVKFGLKLISLLSYSNMMLSIIPFRAGEFSYIHGFKKYFDIDYGKGTSKLFLVRFADYITVYFIFLISSFYVASNISNEIVKLISIIFFVSLIIFGLCLFIIKKISSNKINNLFVGNILNNINHGIDEITKTNNKDVLILLFLSFLYWFARLIMGFLILITLNLHLDFLTYSFFSLILLLIGLIPVKSFGDFGIFEGGWAIFLVNLGFNYEEVLPIIFQYHLILFFIPITYGVIGFLILKSYFNSNTLE